jgi:hypothetical protein
MRNGRRISRGATFSALPIALWATIPAITWCPVGWDQVRPECFIEQVATARASAPHAMSCEGASALRTLECPGSACLGGDGALAATCPLSTPCADESPASPDGPRAYCLSEPNGGSGLRSIAPDLPPNALQPALVGAQLVPEPPLCAYARLAVEPEARPPTHAWALLPPARAPPARELV